LWGRHIAAATRRKNLQPIAGFDRKRNFGSQDFAIEPVLAG
jgi:hypothetical protein